MGDIVTTAGAALGGLGIFILAIGMMTEGLKAAVGPGLRHVLANWTKTPARGIAAGFMMTAIVQSSSAVTVASLGFVNASLMNMRQVLGVIFGANVGTTMTGWLVAAVGFEFNIQRFALPLIGVGMILKLTAKQGRWGSTGLVLIGFGLFFMGLDVLKDTFDALTQTFSLTQMTASGVTGIVTYLFIGIVMTILTQSSSASIALTITAASSGLIGVYAAGAMVIGANIGTTSTAIFAAISATSPAKRAAAAQVLFNLGTAVIALILLPILFYVITFISESLELSTAPAVSLALFHTLFNVMGLILVFPHISRLADWLEKRFLTWEEKESHPRFLDDTVARTPALAVYAVVNELQALQNRVLALYQLAAYEALQDMKHFHQQANVIKTLSNQTSHFIVSLESAALPDEATEQLATLLRVEYYLSDCTAATQALASSWTFHASLSNKSLQAELSLFLKQIYEYMRTCTGQGAIDGTGPGDSLATLDKQHSALKARLIMAGTQREVDIDQMTSAIECVQDAWHIVKTWDKAAHRLNSLLAVLTPDTSSTSDDTPARVTSQTTEG